LKTTISTIMTTTPTTVDKLFNIGQKGHESTHVVHMKECRTVKAHKTRAKKNKKTLVITFEHEVDARFVGVF
jgi:hypothetical protein